MAEHLNKPSSTYRVFISYTLNDKVLAEYLTSELRRILGNYNAVYNFSLPGTQDSVAGSRPADNFGQIIDDSLRACNVFILLWSETARRKRWINYELTHAKRFLIKKVKRMGREFKLIPVRIDRCGMPFSLEHLMHIDYSSGTDPQATLNQILNALGLPEEHADPHIIFQKKLIFEVRTVFDRGEWQSVAQEYSALVQTYPTIVSSEMQYRYSIALLNLGQLDKSLVAVNEGLALENKEEDLVFLERYAQLLKEKRLWNKILPIINNVIAKFPTNAHWLQMHWEVVNHVNSTPPFFLTPSPQLTQQISQSSSVDANGTNGAKMLTAENLQTSFVPFQQFPPHYQSNFTSNNTVLPQQIHQQPFGLDTNQVPPNNPPSVTRKLSEEELQTEMESDTSWQKANVFTEKHISHLKIERVLEPSVIFVAVANIIYIALASFLLSSNNYVVGFAAILILLILCVGRFVESEAIKLACISLLIIFWAISAYYCGYRLFDLLDWKSQNSLGVCFGIISAILVASVGGRLHLRLFHYERV